MQQSYSFSLQLDSNKYKYESPTANEGVSDMEIGVGEWDVKTIKKSFSVLESTRGMRHL